MSVRSSWCHAAQGNEVGDPLDLELNPRLCLNDFYGAALNVRDTHCLLLGALGRLMVTVICIDFCERRAVRRSWN